MYGLTECKRVSYLPPDQIDVRPDSVGKRRCRTKRSYIVDDDGQSRWRPGGRRARGARLERDAGLLGAARGDGADAQAGPLPGETVLYTGDLFRMDDEGYLYFVGRKDDMIKSRGEKVSPREVENVTARARGRRRGRGGRACPTTAGPGHQGRHHAEGRRDADTAVDVLRHCARRAWRTSWSRKIVEFATAADNDDGKIDTPGAATTAESRRDMSARRASRLDGPSALDADARRSRIAGCIRRAGSRTLKRRGVVLGLSGGIDSSVAPRSASTRSAPDRVLGLLHAGARILSPRQPALGQLVGSSLGIRTCPRRHHAASSTPPAATDAATRPSGVSCPNTARVTIARSCCPSQLEADRYNVFSVVVEAPAGEERSARLTADALSGDRGGDELQAARAQDDRVPLRRSVSITPWPARRIASSTIRASS